MESVRNRIDVKLVTHWERHYGAEAYIARPNFHTISIFNENLVAIQLKKNGGFDEEAYLCRFLCAGSIQDLYV